MPVWGYGRHWGPATTPAAVASRSHHCTILTDLKRKNYELDNLFKSRIFTFKITIFKAIIETCLCSVSTYFIHFQLFFSLCRLKPASRKISLALKITKSTIAICIKAS